MIDNYEEEFEGWLEFERNKPANKKNFVGDRAYRHLDGRISRKFDLETGARHKLISALKHPERLAQHSFYPFLRRDKKVRRFIRKYDKNGKILGKKGVEIKTKNRPIMYASHQDACVYGFYAYMLKEKYDKQISNTPLDSAVIAYRRIARDDNSGRNKSNVDFANDIYNAVIESRKCAVICLDIKGFFDKMRHDNIESSWKMLLGRDILPLGHKLAFKNITNYRYIFLGQLMEKMGEGKIVKGKFRYTDKVRKRGMIGNPKKYNKLVNGTDLIHENKSIRGIPQGSPISDIIANMYLKEFDAAIVDKLSSDNHKSLYKRYSDDMLILCDQANVVEIYEYVEKMLGSHDIDLSLSDSKTELFYVDVDAGLLQDKTGLINPDYSKNKKVIQYLGFEFDLRGINIRSGTIANHYRKIALRAKHKNDDKKSDQKKKTSKSKEPNDMYQYFKQSLRKTGSPRVLRQFKKVTKRTDNLLK